MTEAPAATLTFIRVVRGPIIEFAPMVVAPASQLSGNIVASAAIFTVESIQVVVGSIISTPFNICS